MINVRLLDMPTSVRATHTLNDDGSYTVFINARQSNSVQKDAYIHEIEHIENEDFIKNINVEEIEIKRHME